MTANDISIERNIMIQLPAPNIFARVQFEPLKSFDTRIYTFSTEFFDNASKSKI